MSRRTGRFATAPLPAMDEARTRRFWRHVDRRENGECWPYKGSVSARGYGKFYVGTRPLRAHRCAWAIANARDPGRLCVLHRCDNPPCCNPAHLFLGTVADNNRDTKRKGRYRRTVGENHPAAKLTADQATEIRQEYPRLGAAALAKRFNVTASCVQAIVARRRWRHLA